MCVCPSVCLRSTGQTVGPTDLKFGTRIKDHHISDKFEGQGHRAKVKVTKVKNVKITVFNLVSEKMVQGQGHKGQGHQGQGRRSRSKVVGQGHRVKVKIVWGVLYPIDSREVRHAGVFILLFFFSFFFLFFSISFFSILFCYVFSISFIFFSFLLSCRLFSFLSVCIFDTFTTLLQQLTLAMLI